MYVDRCDGAGVTVLSGMLPIIISYSHPNAFLSLLHRGCTFRQLSVSKCIYTGLYWYNYEIRTGHALSVCLTCASSHSSQHQQKGVSPRMLKALVSRGHPEFSSNRQQDAHEFLLHLVNLVEVSKAVFLLTRAMRACFCWYQNKMLMVLTIVETHTSEDFHNLTFTTN